MKNLIYLMCLLPTLLSAQNSLNTERNDKETGTNAAEEVSCQFKYIFELKKYSGLFMCPVLSPKMATELENINACDVQKDENNQIITFELDSLFSVEDIKYFFVRTIGIPDPSIIDIQILKNEK